MAIFREKVENGRKRYVDLLYGFAFYLGAAAAAVVSGGDAAAFYCFFRCRVSDKGL